MNGEVEILKTESVIFKMSGEQEKISEDKKIETEVAKESVTNNVSTSIENRFARLKRNLRKRSISIL
ncbi:MAG TPA: hypothetical protein VF556_09485 [Pyrinomonadaceae bacterium]|jgi:hypothetical protein